MRSIEVVELKIVSKPLTDGGKRASRQGARSLVVRQVDMLILDRTPEPLGKDVVQRLAEACASAEILPVHADPNIAGQQAARVARASEMAALIAVPDLGSRRRKRAVYGWTRRPTDRFEHEVDL